MTAMILCSDPECTWWTKIDPTNPDQAHQAERAHRVKSHSTVTVGPLHGHAGVSVTVVVRCGFIGCDWSMEIGSAPLEAHAAYLDHLDTHDPDHVDDCDQEDGPATASTLYAGDTAEQIAAGQARVDRFMAGGNDV